MAIVEQHGNGDALICGTIKPDVEHPHLVLILAVMRLIQRFSLDNCSAVTRTQYHQGCFRVHYAGSTGVIRRFFNRRSSDIIVE
jgi:hypothetical protein